MSDEDIEKLIAAKKAEWFINSGEYYKNGIKKAFVEYGNQFSLQEIIDIWNEVKISGVLES